MIGLPGIHMLDIVGPQHCEELSVFTVLPQGQVPGPTDFTAWTETQVKVSQAQMLVSGCF